MDTSELEALLAERFRSERKRLNLSAETVAHYCQVSNSTVFNWESRKARIPLGAIAVLWEHGLDIEGMVRTEVPEAHLPLYPESDASTFAVQKNILLRHGIRGTAGMVYQCPSQIGSMMPAGELCLMGHRPTDRKALADADGVFLFKSRKKRMEVFCGIKSAGKNLLRLSLNGRKTVIGQKQFIEHFEILGEHKARLGYRPLTDDAGSVNLSNFLELAEEAKSG